MRPGVMRPAKYTRRVSLPAGALRSCDLCGDDGAAVTDHCHAHEWVRGALCDPCNQSLGRIDGGRYTFSTRLARVGPEAIGAYLARCPDCPPRTADQISALLLATKGTDHMRHARPRHQADESDPVSRAAPGGKITRAQRAAAYLLLIAVMASVAAMSWAGTYGWARQVLHWTPTHAIGVPVSLDVAAMACALLALDAIADGENGTTFRLLAALFVGLSAFTNWRWALMSGSIAEQVFFPSMSVLAYLLAHAVFERIRRKVKRAQQQGGETIRRAVKPLPRLGVLPWLPVVGSPKRALGAVRRAVAERVPDPPAVAHRDIPATVVLDGLSQADAIRRAIESVGQQPREVVAYLESHGWPGVATQRVYDVIRRDSMRAVTSTGDQAAI